MAGCFGNHPYDRYLEGQLNQHLAQYDTHEFAISGTITHLDENKLPVVVQIDEVFETKYEADNEVRDAFIEHFCDENGISRDRIEDYDLNIPDCE